MRYNEIFSGLSGWIPKISVSKHRKTEDSKQQKTMFARKPPIGRVSIKRLRLGLSLAASPGNWHWQITVFTLQHTGAKPATNLSVAAALKPHIGDVEGWNKKKQQKTLVKIILWNKHFHAPGINNCRRRRGWLVIFPPPRSVVGGVWRVGFVEAVPAPMFVEKSPIPKANYIGLWRQ